MELNDILEQTEHVLKGDIIEIKDVFPVIEKVNNLSEKKELRQESLI